MTLVERLRIAMAEPAPPPPHEGDDVGIDTTVAPIAAAVLVAITDRATPGVLLTVRHGALRNHAGQVAFPGGRVDPGDAGVEAAALREAHEEIALDPGAVTLIGCDTPYRTVTGFSVTPVIGVVPADLPLVPAEAEVEALFEVPLAYAMDPANMAVRQAEWRGAIRVYREMMWDGQRIWGATAAMLVNLRRRIGWIG